MGFLFLVVKIVSLERVQLILIAWDIDDLLFFTYFASFLDVVVLVNGSSGKRELLLLLPRNISLLE